MVQRPRRYRGGAALVGDRRRRRAGEVDSVWIHLGRDQRPARIESFGVYAEATGWARVSTRSSCLDPPPEAPASVSGLCARPTSIRTGI